MSQTKRKPYPKRYQIPDDPRGMSLMDRDIDILVFVQDRRLINSSQLCHIFGASKAAIRRRLLRLFEHGMVGRLSSARKILSVAGQGSHDEVYYIERAGLELLKAHGRVPAYTRMPRVVDVKEKFLVHQLGLNDFFARLIKSVRAGKSRLLYSRRLIESMPPLVQNRKNNHFALRKCSVTIGGHHREMNINPDDAFAVKQATAPQFFFLEWDTGSMPVIRSDNYQSSILQKLIGYSYFHTQKKHVSDFEIKDFTVIIATSSQTRIATMIQAFKESKVINPELFWFTTREAVTSTDDLLTLDMIDGTGKVRKIARP